MASQSEIQFESYNLNSQKHMYKLRLFSNSQYTYLALYVFENVTECDKNIHHQPINKNKKSTSSSRRFTFSSHIKIT